MEIVKQNQTHISPHPAHIHDDEFGIFTNGDIAFDLMKAWFPKEKQKIIAIPIQTTTSLKVAEVFGKKHFHVMRDIRNLECSDEFRQSNFGLAYYQDNQGKPREMFTMTRKGFEFLTLGFTGRKAAQFREAYINRFHEMEKQLKQYVHQFGDRYGMVLHEGVITQLDGK